MFRLALCGKNCELLEKIKSHIQIFVETYKNETKCISIEQYKQLASYTIVQYRILTVRYSHGRN